ncbi:MAG: DUF934 domain-containing protein [Fluviibacter sp.]
MAEILKNGQAINDNWQVLRLEADANAATAVVEAGQWLVPFKVWQAQHVVLQTRTGEIAVWLAPDDDLSAVAAAFTAWPLIAIDFPKFTDGRGYSMAWRLRNHHQYRGELRAIGNVLVDQLFFMLRVGFDTLALDPRVSTATALSHLTPFPDTYQGSTDNPNPLFRREDRLLGGARS